MIWNIVDNRKNPYRWMRITAVVEPTWHDNTCKNADHAAPAVGEIDYEIREHLTLADAVDWANGLPFPLTLHLYDADDENARPRQRDRKDCR